MTGPGDMWNQAAAKWSDTIAQVGDDDWDKSTTCGEWTVRELVDHAMHWQGMGGSVLGAGTAPGQDWSEVQPAMAAALQDPANFEGNVEEFGNMPRQGVAGLVIADLLLHSWDLARSIGADDNFMMFHAEGHPLAVQPSGERKLEKGDLILAEMTPSYRGQFSQICRTACVGEPTNEQQEKYNLVVTAMKNGIGRAKAGVPMKEICLGVDEVLCDNGYAAYCAPPYMNRRGHGLGIASMAPGNVSLNNETILEDGMFFVVHPNQYIPEVGYLLCGEPIIVRENGADVLTKNRAALGAIPL